MANITKYDDNGKQLWRISGYLGVDPKTGKQKNINRKGFKTKKEATQSLNKAIKRLENGEHTIQRKSLTYEELYHEWLEFYSNSVRESTLRTTKELFKSNVLPQLGKILIHKITAKDLQKYINKMHKETAMYKTYYWQALRPLKYAFQQEYINNKPYDRVIVPTKKLDYGKTESKRKFWDKHELNKFMSYIEDEEDFKPYAMARVLAYTGMRCGELRALTWQDINFKDSTISVNKTVAKTEKKLVINETKTENSNRIITIETKTRQILKEWRSKQAKELLIKGYNSISKNQLVFSNGKNSLLSHVYFRSVLKRVCNRHSDLESISTHGFRHTHCSLLFEAGVPIKDVKERLGHSDIQTTMNIYTHVTPQSRDESAEKFARFLEANN